MEEINSESIAVYLQAVGGDVSITAWQKHFSDRKAAAIMRWFDDLGITAKTPQRYRRHPRRYLKVPLAEALERIRSTPYNPPPPRKRELLYARDPWCDLLIAILRKGRDDAQNGDSEALNWLAYEAPVWVEYLMPGGSDMVYKFIDRLGAVGQ